MSFWDDLKILYAMAVAPIRGHSHATRLESFYSRQTRNYDDFRARLLHGRDILWKRLPVPCGGIWVDMGGGTASNVEYLGEHLRQLHKLYVVDLSPALLGVARQRCQARGWENVEVVEADVTKFVPPAGQVDVITFSYSLTMIPEWFVALQHAWDLLRPGGLLGVVDFYVSRKYPEADHHRHAWYTRLFWTLWFGRDNVFPNPDHIPFLHWRFMAQYFIEACGPMPYLPGVRAPYYVFIGRKPFPAAVPPSRADAAHSSLFVGRQFQGLSAVRNFL